MTDYQRQANDFLMAHNAALTVEKLGHFPHFEDDTPRDVYQVKITRTGHNPYLFKFGQSLARSATKENLAKIERARGDGFTAYLKAKKQIQPPTAYDVLACVTKHDPGTFEDFCSEFGYDMDSKKATKIYFDVQKEYHAVIRLFSDCMEELQEIA